MPTMPGEVYDGPWEPDEKVKPTHPYKPDMAEPDQGNPFTKYLGQPAAQKVTEARPSTWERFKAHFNSQQDYGWRGLDERGEIRDAQAGYVNGVFVGKDAAAAQADFLRSKKEEEWAQFERMPAAETAMDYMAAIGGSIAGSVLDPFSLAAPEVKIGTTAWRMKSPVLSRVLDASVSNAAMNAAINAQVQAQDNITGLREGFDYLSFIADAGAGALIGLPFGYMNGRAAAEEAAARLFANAPAPGTAPSAPRFGPRPERLPVTEGQATPEAVSTVHTSSEINAAQESLFGEVVGTRNLTPEQLNQLDDYLNAGKPGEIPQAPVETEGSAGPDELARAAFDTESTRETMPVRGETQPQDQTVPPVRERGGEEGAAQPAPVPIGRQYREFAPAELRVDAKRFQFKEGGNEAGVTDRLKGVKNWDQTKAGVTLVWEDRDGNFFIADGHQRHGLATRLEAEGQQPRILGLVLREADGISADEARVIAAAKNIAEGTGNAIDAAKILRSNPKAATDLPPTSALVRDAQGLAKLSDDAFGMVINKKVPAGYAAIVGRLAPDPKTHSELLGVLAKEQPDNAIEAESMVRDALEAPAVQSTMEDMFGSAEVTQILFKERAQVLSAAATAIRKDRAAFSTLVREEARLTGAGNKLATETNVERATQDAEILATLQATARRKGPIADALAAAAKRLKDGEPRQTVVRDFLDTIRKPQAPTGPDGGGAGASRRPGEAIAASLGGYRNTDSPAFKRWFGESKVVDENGEPLVVYHGTSDPTFDRFSKRHQGGMGGPLGFWFASKGEATDAFSRTRYADQGGGVFPVYLTIQKPMEYRDWAEFTEHVEKLRKGGKSIEEGVKSLRRGLGSRGYDGVVIRNSTTDTGVLRDDWVAFQPTQIKSIFNRGTWDPEDPRIAFSSPMRPLPYNRLSLETSDAQIEATFPMAKDRVDGRVVRDEIPNMESIGASIENPETLSGVREILISEFEDRLPPASPDKRTRDLADAIKQSGEISPLIVVIDKKGPYILEGGHRFDALKMLGARSFPAKVVLDLDSLPETAGGIAFSTRQPGPGLFDVEPGAEGKPQMVLPGAERISDKRLADLKAKAPLRASRPQKDMDFGLFGDGQNQLDLVDLARIPKMVKADADYLDLSPSGYARTATIGDASITYAARDGEIEILAVRIPTELRRQGRGRAAVMAFLDKADEQGLAIRTLATPLDRTLNREAVTKFYESLGFTATGKKVRGDMEMLRTGPPPELQELRELVGSGRLIPLRDYTDPEMAKKVQRAFIATQPERTTDELYSSGILEARQKELVRAGEYIQRETGATFGNPGVKARAKAEDKIGRKGYRSTRQLTDLARGGFMVETPDQAQRIVNLLAKFFDVLDEGWTITPHYYFDRKVLVRFSDGTIGEVQIWEPSLLDAKMRRGGHKDYDIWREAPNSPEGLAAGQRMIDLYQPLVEALDPSWGATVGRGGNWPNVARNSSSPDNLRPESATSAGLTEVQSSPGARTAKAEPSDQTAGRASQSTNTQSIETSVSPQGKAFSARPQPGSNMPVNRSQSGVPTIPRPMKVERLEDISADLAAITGAPVRQGRLQRAPKGKVAGQYDRDQGVIRLREMSDFETQTHETAHSLETEWGRDLQNLKWSHAAELDPLAYAGADPRAVTSEGFAEWLRFYVTAPQYARRQAPNFTRDFEAMLTARAPEQLDALRDIGARYRAWTMAPSGAAVAADIVSSRRGGTISEAVNTMRQEGPRAAIGEWMSRAYAATIDKLNPINRSVDELLKIYEARTGQALDIKSAEDPYRLARLLQDAYSAGHIDAMHGVVPYHGVAPEGPSLSDAITAALGNNFRGWDDVGMADFAAYLVSRRAIKEYDRFLAGELPNPPGKFTRGDYVTTVQELEAAHPNYRVAADMVYQWGRNMLRKKYESGFIPEKVYLELLQREDYVPMMRDLRDLDKEPGAPSNRTLRQSIMKAFRGSKRSVINPLESMLADSYQFNALMKRNDVFRALDDLAKMAGPGSGAIIERIPSTQLKGTKVGVDEVLRTAAKEAGLSPQDIDHLTTFVDDMLGEDATATVFRAGEINEKGERIIYVWRDGKKQALRLADGQFGKDMYDALTGMNKEARNVFVSALALPSTVVRYGVTTAPHFIIANYIRDQVSAWVLAGDGYVPFLSGARGIFDELTQAESARIYAQTGGIFGGGNVASLDKGRVKRDISALNKKGYHIKRFASIRGFNELTGISETGTRLGIFRNAYARGKKAGLTDYEAAIEAVYQARDYIDFGRHGSQTHTARRLVTFLNASIQGLDKTFRVLTGEGSVRKAIAPYVAFKAGRPLSKRDKANLGKAAMAWAKVTAIGVFGLSLSYLYRDDPEYEEISDYLRATHWMVKKGPGEWVAIPKPFELGFASNLFERSFDAVYGRNPIAMQSFISGLYEVTAPPMGIPLFETMYELKHGKDDLGRDIVGRDIAGFEPWRQYTAQTSEIAKALGRAVNVSPAMIDHAIQGFGASWGKIIVDASTARNQGKGVVETAAGAITNRFIRDVTRGATSTRQFWELMGESSGAMSTAGSTYKDLVESGSLTEAERLLDSKDENTKAYALMAAYFEAGDRRLHPLNRAKDAMSVISKLRRELAGNAVTSTEESTDEDEVKITLTPSQRQMAQDFLSKISMIEARNALIVLGVPGWGQRELMETESLYEDLRTTSPELADELQTRMEKKKVYDFEAVREAWPDVKERLLLDRQDASFDDIVAGM